MRRSQAQEVMDAARGDPEGKLRSAAWEAYSALQEETNSQGWDPPGPPSPFAIESRGYGPVTFPIAGIRPWVFHEPSIVTTPADDERLIESLVRSKAPRSGIKSPLLPTKRKDQS